MTVPTPTSGNTDVTRDPYVLLMACLTFHKLPPELRKAIKECVDARPAPVQIAELQKDAERWQWICAYAYSTAGRGPPLRAAIATAIAGKEGK